jgi:hypothetical protein
MGVLYQTQSCNDSIVINVHDFTAGDKPASVERHGWYYQCSNDSRARMRGPYESLSAILSLFPGVLRA